MSKESITRENHSFVDIHAHILPGIDDGADSMPTSLAMLRMAREEGISVMVSTPHYLPGTRVFHNELQQERLHLLREAAAAEAIPIRILAGNELHLDEQLIQCLADGRCLPLGDSKAVLIEIPATLEVRHAIHLLLPLVEDGWCPVIAHAERMQNLQRCPEDAEQLRDIGCLFQVNASSVTSGLLSVERRTVKSLLDAGYADIVSSDCHSTGRRAPRLLEAWRTIRRWTDPVQADRLFHDNAHALLFGSRE